MLLLGLLDFQNEYEGFGCADWHSPVQKLDCMNVCLGYRRVFPQSNVHISKKLSSMLFRTEPLYDQNF